MGDLMRQTGETANLGVEKEGRVVFLSQVETHEAIRAFFPPGTRSPMYASGIGKALLAWYSPARIDQILRDTPPRPHTPHTLIDRAAIDEDIRLTRAKGYAVDNEERTEGMRCIAAPIFNSFGEPVAGLSVSGPAFRMQLSEADRIGALVAKAARAVTRAVGGTSPDA
jgi:IclR family acetate operon transcriptional repressor